MMIIVEEWFDTNGMFPTPKKEMVRKGNKYIERTYVLDGSISVLNRIVRITREEFEIRLTKKLSEDN